MVPHEYVAAVRTYVQAVHGTIAACWSAERRYPGCSRRSFEPRLEEWTTVVDVQGTSTSPALRESVALRLGLKLLTVGLSDQLFAVVERRCPGRDRS